MGLWSLKIFYSFSAGTDFRRQNLTSIDVRFWRLKSVPALKEKIMVQWWANVSRLWPMIESACLSSEIDDGILPFVFCDLFPHRMLKKSNRQKSAIICWENVGSGFSTLTQHCVRLSLLWGREPITRHKHVTTAQTYSPVLYRNSFYHWRGRFNMTFFSDAF